MQEPRQIEVNTYNLNDRKFGYRDDDLNTSQTDYNNNNNNNSASYYGGPAARAANPQTYINEYARQDYDDDEPHEPIQINNPIYYQQQPQQQPPQQPQRQYSGSRGPTPPTPTRRVTPPPALSSQPGGSQLPTVAEAGVREQRENEAANRQLYRGDDDDDGPDDDDPDVRMRDQRSQQEYYFNTQVRNTGYWGKVRLRRGTWMVIVGLFFMCVSLTIISVFWAFWYHPAANIPCRVVGVTMLVWSTFTVVAGLISNWCMISDPIAKFFIGSPVRWTSWVLLGSSIAITIASVLITIYYTYWHNRWVNTPMIIIAIVFYFFGGLAFIFAFFYNLKLMVIDMKRARGIPVDDGKKKRVVSDSDEETDEEEYRNEDYVDNNNEKEDAEEKLDELYAMRAAGNPYMATTQSVVDNESETGGKRDFRKKNIQLKPRNLLDTSYQNALNSSVNQSPDQSLNNTTNSKK